MATKTTEQTLPAGRTLWEIGSDLEALEDLLMEVGGDVTDEEAERAIDAWLEETREAEIQEKEAARLMERAQVNRNAVRRLKDRLLAYMDRRGTPKLSGNLYSFTASDNGGKLPLIVDDVDPMTLPPQYRKAVMVLLCPTDETLEALKDQCAKLEVEPDGDAIRAALEAGQELDFARFGQRGRHITVR